MAQIKAKGGKEHSGPHGKEDPPRVFKKKCRLPHGGGHHGGAWKVAYADFVTAMMALYGYYLGHRRDIEDRQGAALSSELLRCPFVMGILGKTVGGAGTVSAAPASKG